MQARRGARSCRASACSRRRRKRRPAGSSSRWSASRSPAAPCRPRPPPPTRRRAAGRALRIARIARRARVEIGELGRHRLADDHRARCAQPRDRRAVAHRLTALEQRRAAFGRIIGGIEDVLDADRNAVQRADRAGRCGGARRARGPAPAHLADRGGRKRVPCPRSQRCDRGRRRHTSPRKCSPPAIRSAASIAVSAVSSPSSAISSRRACWAARAQCPGRCRPESW